MQGVLREVERRGVDLSSSEVLEVFGGVGTNHLSDYASTVQSLEIWERQEEFCRELRRKFPFATVKSVDSYREAGETDHRFDLIVVDNPQSMHGEHCEHFSLFPQIFRCANPKVVLILNVFPSIDDFTRRRWPEMFNPEQLDRRADFYGVSTPENLSLIHI